jgi:hypothetical protein
MKQIKLHLKLKSDATFGRGEAVPGLVDSEIEHDTTTGLPFLRGRTLKGLLVEECANILFALQNDGNLEQWEAAAKFLFGEPGSSLKNDGHMLVGAATLPEELQKAIEADVLAGRLRPDDVFASLTAIRRQTAINDETGAPEKGSLRAMRVLLRETPLVAQLDFDQEPLPNCLALLAACASSLRRAGTGRNRGRGRLEVYLDAPKVTTTYLAAFRTMVGG